MFVIMMSSALKEWTEKRKIDFLIVLDNTVVFLKMVISFTISLGLYKIAGMFTYGSL